VTRQVRNVFDESDYPDLLVGMAVADDAAVWRVDDQRALVFTTDFFTPIVDDPYDWGAIAAANALSDIYAMGGELFLALNIAAFPEQLPEAMIAEILRGGAEKTREAGAIVAGGHTVDDDEPKFGLAVLGYVPADRIGTKGAARVGDIIVLTKPLGVGLITTAFKANEADLAHMAVATDWMKRLNKAAAQALEGADVHAVTDVTGFGLLGHAMEVAERSHVALRIRFDDLPFHPGTMGYADDLLFPAAANCNKDTFEGRVRFAERLEYEMQLLLFCPETSGGLLVTLAPDDVSGYLARLATQGGEAWIIGEVTADGLTPGDEMIEVV